MEIRVAEERQIEDRRVTALQVEYRELRKERLDHHAERAKR